MKTTLSLTTAAAVLALAAGCSAPQDDGDASNVSLRNLTETTASAPLQDDYQIGGDLIPTPSDTKTRYFLVRHRKPLGSDNLIAIIREQGEGKAAYARVEVNCEQRRFGIISVADRRDLAEASTNVAGPMGPIEQYPLRQDLAKFICERHGMSLAPAG